MVGTEVNVWEVVLNTVKADILYHTLTLEPLKVWVLLSGVA